MTNNTDEIAANLERAETSLKAARDLIENGYLNFAEWEITAHQYMLHQGSIPCSTSCGKVFRVCQSNTWIKPRGDESIIAARGEV
jgi:hypothetical protein